MTPLSPSAYQELRERLGKPDRPLNVIVTARGTVSLDLPVFQSGEVPVLLVTTTQDEARLQEQSVPRSAPHQNICERWASVARRREPFWNLLPRW